ncbi:MAG: hypothetical protein ABEJ85_05700 [Haloarculaceae archaeon]
MIDQLAELGGELLGVAVYVVVASVLTVLGVLAEWTGVHNLQTGHTTIGAWEVAVGALVLYAAVSVLQEFVFSELRARRAAE